MRLIRAYHELLLPLTVVLAISFVLVCPAKAGSWTSSGVSYQELPDTLRIGFLQQIDSLNPYLGLNDASYIFYGLIYDMLQSVDEDMKSVPNLALESKIVDVAGAPHGSVWEYDLTHNATWHDGQPFGAADVAWNINLNCLGSNYSDMWAYQPYTFFAKYAEVIDSDTVRVTYYDRSNGSLIPCAYGDFLPIHMLPSHLLSTYSTSFLSFQWLGYFTGTSPPIVGTGPFMVTPSIAEEFLAGSQITLVRNPDYHALPDRGEIIHFQNLVMKFYDDATAMKIALEQKRLDIAQFPQNTFKSIEHDIAAGSLQNVKTYSGLKCTQYWTEIGFNMNNAGPNKWRLDPEARHALAQAVNKSYIVNNFYYGCGGEGTGLISPITPYWHWEPSAAEHWDYDLAAAAAALQAAGYVDTNGDGWRECTASSAAVQNGWSLEGAKLNLEMLTRHEHPEEKEITMYLQEQWAQIGIDMTWQVVTEDNLAMVVYSYSYDSMIWYWSSDPDPNFMLFCQSEKSINGWSDNMYYNPAYEENYTNSVRELDPVKRQEYVHNCQKISYEDAAYIVLTYVYGTYAWRTDTFTGWGNWSYHPGRSIDAYWGANPLFFDLESANLGLVIREHAGDFRIPLPETWTVEENATVDGEELDMIVRGPVYNDFMTNIVVTSERDRSASESSSYLFASMNETVEELQAEGEQVSTSGTPFLWETDNYSAIGFYLSWSDPQFTQLIALYSSEEHNRVWAVVCSADDDAFLADMAMFQDIVTGFEVIRTSDNGTSTLLIAVLVVTGAVAAAVVVLVLLLLRRKPSPQSPVPPTQPTVPGQMAPMSGYCPICGNVQTFTNRMCARCGNALPSPPFGRSGVPPVT